MEKKKYKDMTPEEKEKFLKDAKKVGAAATGTGAFALSVEEINRLLAKRAGKPIPVKKAAVASGAAMTAAGLGTYGTAKLKLKRLKKDDSSKK